MDTPVVVEFPLRGEWTAPNTPGKKVPESRHGHARAAVCLRLCPHGWKSTGDAVLSLLSAAFLHPWRAAAGLLWLGTAHPLPCGWDGSPGAGRLARENPVHLVRDLAIALKNSLTLTPIK